MRHFYLPREDSPVLRGVAPTPVALANLKGTAMIVGLESELCKCSLPRCILTHPVVRADLLVVGGIAAALALVAAAVVARPAFVAPDMKDAYFCQSHAVTDLPRPPARARPSHLRPPIPPAISAFALSVAGADLPLGAPGAVDVVALAVFAIHAEVEIGEALAHPSADARAATVANHVWIFWILAS